MGQFLSYFLFFCLLLFFSFFLIKFVAEVLRWFSFNYQKKHGVFIQFLIAFNEFGIEKLFNILNIDDLRKIKRDQISTFENLKWKKLFSWIIKNVFYLCSFAWFISLTKEFSKWIHCINKKISIILNIPKRNSYFAFLSNLMASVQFNCINMTMLK